MSSRGPRHREVHVLGEPPLGLGERKLHDARRFLPHIPAPHYPRRCGAEHSMNQMQPSSQEELMGFSECKLHS